MNREETIIPLAINLPAANASDRILKCLAGVRIALTDNNLDGAGDQARQAMCSGHWNIDDCRLENQLSVVGNALQNLDEDVGRLRRNGNVMLIIRNNSRQDHH